MPAWRKHVRNNSGERGQMGAPRFEARLAETDADRRAAQRLRYEVFVAELGGDGEMVDHAARLERDSFDAHAEQLLLIDRARGDDAETQVVGVYRLMTQDAAARAGQFYSESEYDLARLRASGRKLLELGRSCLHRDYRGGTAMLHLWTALADLVQARGIELLFGVASFHGTDLERLAAPLSLLHARHLAPEPLRVRARAACFQAMDLVPAERLDRRAAMREVPALIKSYLRLGGVVGEGAFIDHAFNTTDVCLILDTEEMKARPRAIFGARR